MHLLATGGCGFVESHIALHLRAKGHKISANGQSRAQGSEENIATLERHGISFFHGDVRNREDLSNLPTGNRAAAEMSSKLRTNNEQIAGGFVAFTGVAPSVLIIV